ncbi:chaplin family protein [Asanoa sp. WMMD1127]|uniref:chaplin family protein n=1 Tax=Asanoa sp. WMMD1127 TaxID=3016107 RepID=UPI002415FF11|nr:chaplin family protein [Asanoa sp. WMMD1127]MDG4823819.1 chaplin family protein [Asanoa sp. WMMD1127]
MTIKRRLAASAALPAAGLAVVAGALALTGQAAGAAPLGDGMAPADNGDGTAAAAADRAQSVADEARDAALDGAALLPPAADPTGDEAATDEEGPAELPAAARFGSGVSHIASGQNAGILNGTQVVVPIQIPVNVCGNSLAVLGGAAASCGDDDEEEPPAPPVDEEPPPPTAQEEPPPVPLPRPVAEPPAAQPELPKTGLPVGSIAGLGGVLTAGGAAMQLAGVRRGARYVGRHRRRPSPS